MISSSHSSAATTVACFLIVHLHVSPPELHSATVGCVEEPPPGCRCASLQSRPTARSADREGTHRRRESRASRFAMSAQPRLVGDEDGRQSREHDRRALLCLLYTS